MSVGARGAEVVDVGPVGDHHAVPVKAFLKPSVMSSPLGCTGTQLMLALFTITVRAPASTAALKGSKHFSSSS